MKLIRVDYYDITEKKMDDGDVPPKPCLVTEFGLFLEEDNRNLWLIKDYHHDGADWRVCVIPKGCVEKVTRLREIKL